MIYSRLWIESRSNIRTALTRGEMEQERFIFMKELLQIFILAREIIIY